jgi:hypothetical protein
MTENTGNGISGKMKTKRHHAPSKPYERKKSLLGSLADTMKVVVTPSWLSDIVKNVTRATKSDKPETEKVTNGDDGNLLNEAPKQNPNSSAFSQLPENPAQSMVNTSSCALTPHLPASNNVSCPGPGVALSEKNEASDGCPPDQPFHGEKPLQMQDSMVLAENGVNEDESEDSFGVPYVRSNRSIQTKTWTSDYRAKKLKKPATHSNPSFDLSLFSLPSEKRQLADSGSSHLSPFFSGKTRFGGAMSQNSKINRTAPSLNYVPIRQKMKPKTTSISSTSTAKRILESLQKISPPVNVGQPYLKTKFVHPVENVSRTKFSVMDKGKGITGKAGKVDEVQTKSALYTKSAVHTQSVVHTKSAVHRKAEDSVFTFASPVEKDWSLDTNLPKPKLNFNFSSPINVHDSPLPVSLMEDRIRPHDQSVSRK